MSDAVYRVTEVTGTSNDSWEAAARNAVGTAAKTARHADCRGDQAGCHDRERTLKNYRVRLGISFKYESGD